MAYSLVIFDLDGTVINSAPALIRTSKEVQAEMGLPPLPDEVLREAIGRNIIESMEANYGASPEVAMEFARRFFRRYAEKYCDEVETFPDVEDVISKISETRRTAIATNNGIDSTMGILHILGIDGLFDEVRGVISSGSPTKGEMILDLLATMGIDASEAVLVGDSHSDYMAACSAGVDFIGVLYGYTPDVLRAIDGITLVDSPKGLLDVLGI